MSGIGCCVLLLAIIGYTIAEPRIISSPESITVYTGQAVMFKCQVRNPQISMMSWSSVTHNYTIYNGSQLMLKDNNKRYSLINMAGGLTYNLQILYIQKSDEGFYKCAIQGTGKELTSELRVLERPNTVSPGGNTSSTTERPNTVSPGGNTSSTTGTSSNMQTTHSRLETPRDLMVIKADGFTDVLLTWEMEQKTFNTRFTVFYKKLSEEQFTVISNIATTYYLIKDVKPQTFYTAYVVAKSGYYTDSPPSKEVMFVAGSNNVPNGNKDNINDSSDDGMLILHIGIGLIVAAAILILMVLSMTCILYKGRMKQSTAFDNPDLPNSEAAFTSFQASSKKAYAFDKS